MAPPPAGWDSEEHIGNEQNVIPETKSLSVPNPGVQTPLHLEPHPLPIYETARVGSRPNVTRNKQLHNQLVAPMRETMELPPQVQEQAINYGMALDGVSLERLMLGAAMTAVPGVQTASAVYATVASSAERLSGAVWRTTHMPKSLHGLEDQDHNVTRLKIRLSAGVGLICVIERSVDGAHGRDKHRSTAFSTSSYALVSSKTRSTTRSSNTQVSVKPGSDSPEKPLDSFQDPPIPETPESKSLYQQNRPTPPRRPGVKPPPTLALPSSMLPPAPRVPLPMSLSRKAGSRVSSVHEKTFDIYVDSLNKRDDEPTLDDLDALRPPASTIRAALNGVIGSGRVQLAKNHPLHLAIEQLGAQEATVGGGPKAKKTVVAGSRKAKKLEYQALYAATEGMITRGFTVAQLKRLETETKLQKRHKRIELPSGRATSKPKIIHSLMNIRWGMIHPKVLESYIDEENKSIERSYPVSPSELFIFLGRDGEDLIHLSKELNMRIDVDRQSLDLPADSAESDRSTTRPGFIIRASGVKSNHEKLRKHIENQRDAMTVKIVALPTGSSLSPSLLQNISRIAGAFVENLDPKFASFNDDGSSVASVSITARSPRSAYTAERLVQRAAMEAAHRSQLSLFTILKDGKSVTDEGQDSEHQEEYALYPFGIQGFRVRNVQRADSVPQYPPGNGAAQLPLTTGSLDVQSYNKDEAFILTGEERPKTKSQAIPNMIVRNAHGEVIDLGKYIFGEASGEGERIMTATFGHVVFKTGKPTMLEPPLPKPVSSDSVLEWVDKHDSTARAFTPGQVPFAHLPDNVTSIHRLQYRTVEGGHIINVDVGLPSNDAEPSAESSSNLGVPLEGDDGLELVSATQPSSESPNESSPVSSQLENSSEPTEVQDVDSTSSDSFTKHANDSVNQYPSVEGTSNPTEFTPLPVEITVGTETAFELMLPESTMDICVRISNTASIAKPMVPEVLSTYLDGLSKFFTTDVEMPQPDPPQNLNFDGQYYVLVKNTSARSGTSTLVDLPHECMITSESSLDLENNIRTAFTQITYHGGQREEDWNSFIGACQTLASKRYEKSTELRLPLMASTRYSSAGRSGSKKARAGFSRGLKRLLTNLIHARPKSHSRPDTLTLFEIVTLNNATVRKHASRPSIRYEDSALRVGSSTPSLAPTRSPKATSRPHHIHRNPCMADRIVDVRLESVYDEGEAGGGYVFASALQDTWHAQDIDRLHAG
ncbi:hypothetical protein OPQ81_008658 [Rhizoctonia solani]|nr:hypothetical protein OPQ81_008658 [Rhizoctonia solani]